MDQQTRLPSRYSSQDRHRKHDDDSSTDPGHAMDDLSTSPSDDHDHHNKEKQDDVTTLSLPSEISFTITPRGEDMSSYIEPQQDSPPHGRNRSPFSLIILIVVLLGRDTYRSRYLPPSLAHVTSNTQTATLLVEQKAALPSSHDLPSSSTATNAPNGRENGHNSSSTSHSLFDIVNMDFNSPEPSSSHHQG